MKQDLDSILIKDIIAKSPNVRSLIIAFPLPLTVGDEWDEETLLFIHKKLINSKNYTKNEALKSELDFINRFIAADNDKKLNMFITSYVLLNPELYEWAKLYNV